MWNDREFLKLSIVRDFLRFHFKDKTKSKNKKQKNSKLQNSQEKSVTENFRSVPKFSAGANRVLEAATCKEAFKMHLEKTASALKFLCLCLCL